jgi:hypothetical protein
VHTAPAPKAATKPSPPADVAPQVAVAASNSLEFDSPSGLAAANGGVWVTNRDGNSVTEVSASNGSHIRTVHGSGYAFNRPSAIAVYGSDLFVANGAGFVTELSAGNGAPVRIIAGSQYHFANPVAIALAGSTVVVVNGAGSLTEFSADSGNLVRTVSGSSFGFDNPVALAVSGSDVFVADRGSNAVTEVNTTTGALVRVVRGGGLSAPGGIAVGSGYVWVSDSASNAVTKINASTGAQVGTYSNSNADYGFGQPTVMLTTSSNVFVVTPFGSSPMVTKISPSNTPDWYMCNTNGPYYFSVLSALAVSGSDLWVASSSGANNPNSNAKYGSLTELSTGGGGLIRTLPA